MLSYYHSIQNILHNIINLINESPKNNKYIETQIILIHVDKNKYYLLFQNQTMFKQNKILEHKYVSIHYFHKYLKEDFVSWIKEYEEKNHKMIIAYVTDINEGIWNIIDGCSNDLLVHQNTIINKKYNYNIEIIHPMINKVPFPLANYNIIHLIE